MLMCNFCRRELPTERFSLKASATTGYSTKCKDCHNAYVRERWYPANSDKQKAASAAWRGKNKGRIKAVSLGLDRSDVESVMRRDGATCGICGDERDPVLDHCHETQKPRGILCRNCNTLLGRMGDNEQGVQSFTRKAIEYLHKNA